MYEANPLAMIVEQAGGLAITGTAPPVRLLDIRPTSIHQRSSVVIGSREEVEAVNRHLSG